MKIVSVESDRVEMIDLGASRTVVANVDLGSLSADDVAVQLVHGPIGLSDLIEEAIIVPMAFRGGNRYFASFDCARSGRYGFTVRVVPSHAHLGSWAEVGTLTSA